VRHLDLFSGIGGFALACRMVGGIETVGFCEREPYAQKVLKKHWPDVPISNDIHEMKGNEYGTIDLITGGFPCQPYSLAGERRGNEDDRALWPQMLRVISEARPTWVLGENVPGIITLALDGVLADLEGEGYACETLIIPACGVDAKHRRERIWIVAHRAGNGWRQGKPDTGRGLEGTGPGPQSGPWNDGSALADCEKPGLERTDAARTIRTNGRASECRSDVADSMCRRQSGQREPVDAEHPEAAGNGEATESRNGCRSNKWLAEPNVGRVAHGIPARVDRLRGLGNAIVPQVAAEIIRCIKEIEMLTQ
jgi:DNA (cytosine-5)-methyltransferase 1